MLSMLQLLAVAALGLTAGVFIGCIGVGGVIIVPALVQAGYPVSTAISVAMAGYIPTGLVGTWVFMRHGTLDRRLAVPLCVASMPAAILGALAAQALPALLLELVIAAMTAASGLHALTRRPAPRAVGDEPLAHGPAVLTGVGAIAGFVSALTGTGGPAALIPMLLWLEVSALTTIGLAQVIQLPIGILATIGNAIAGSADLLLGLALGAGLTAGARIGAEIAHGLDQRLLRTLVALMLLGVGLFLGLRVLLSLHGP